MGVTKESFGFLEDKREAFLYTIENQNGFAVKVTDFGVNIVSLLVKNKEGNIKDVALGYDTLEEYFENGIMFGATVGRNVNRISNARFEIDGKEYHVAKNRGKHNIHSDKEHGFHKVYLCKSRWGTRISGNIGNKYHLYGNGNKWIDRFLSCSQR